MGLIFIARVCPKLPPKHLYVILFRSDIAKVYPKLPPKHPYDIVLGRILPGYVPNCRPTTHVPGEGGGCVLGSAQADGWKPLQDAWALHS